MQCVILFGIVIMTAGLVDAGNWKSISTNDRNEVYYLDKCQSMIKEAFDYENRCGSTISMEKAKKKSDGEGFTFHCTYKAYAKGKSKTCEAFVYFTQDGCGPKIDMEPCPI